MATFKKTAKKSSAKSRAKPTPQQQAEQFTKTISESAQQVWLAGVGAFSRAQTEGNKLFENLVKEGLNLEQTARRFAGGQAEAVRGVVESKVDQARERAVDTWDRLEKVFEDRVQRALVKLGVPGRDDLADLSRQVDALTAELRRQAVKPAAAPRASAAKSTARKSATKSTAAQPARRKASKAKSTSA